MRSSAIFVSVTSLAMPRNPAKRPSGSCTGLPRTRSQRVSVRSSSARVTMGSMRSWKGSRRAKRRRRRRAMPFRASPVTQSSTTLMWLPIPSPSAPCVRRAVSGSRATRAGGTRVRRPDASHCQSQAEESSSYSRSSSAITSCFSRSRSRSANCSVSRTACVTQARPTPPAMTSPKKAASMKTGSPDRPKDSVLKVAEMTIQAMAARGIG